jgi:hypothetical protein
MNRPRAVPLRSDFSSTGRPADHFVRAAAVALRYATTPPQTPEGKPITDIKVARDLFGDDKPTEILLRSATDAAAITGGGWAADVAVAAVSDFLAALAPASAGAALIMRGMQVPMDNYNGVRVPGYVTTATDAGGFVGEGQAIAVRSMDLSSALILLPKKFGVITAFTEEATMGSRFEATVRHVLNEAFALALDTALFSTVPGSDTRSPGLLTFVTALSAKSGGGAAAFAEDTKTLIDALVTAGGGRDVVFVCSPATAAAAKNWASVKFDYDILESSAVAKNTLIAIEAPAFASAFLPVPEFSASSQAVLAMDTAASAISTNGTIAASQDIRSLWQTRALALKSVLRCAWGMRASGMIQQITGVSW